MIYKKYLKRVIDVIFAITLLIVTSPLLIIVALLLSVANRGDAFFLQARPGHKGKVFSIIKFKTMNDKRGEDGVLLPDAERLTSVGRIVRKLSIDEIPQLINVVKGEMSLIGPRPLLIEYLALYDSNQARRHEVRPGITGWAQVNGRNAISWKKKFELDLWYVENVSFFLDIRIMILTLRKVFAREGISQEGHATAERFIGNNHG